MENICNCSALQHHQKSNSSQLSFVATTPLQALAFSCYFPHIRLTSRHLIPDFARFQSYRNYRHHFAIKRQAASTPSISLAKNPIGESSFGPNESLHLQQLLCHASRCFLQFATQSVTIISGARVEHTPQAQRL